MAKEIREAKPEEIKTEESSEAAVKEPDQESAYTVEELAANAGRIFGTRQECVEAALKSVEKAECTVSEAKELVDKFLKKEVI